MKLRSSQNEAGRGCHGPEERTEATANERDHVHQGTVTNVVVPLAPQVLKGHGIPEEAVDGMFLLVCKRSHINGSRECTDFPQSTEFFQ